MLFGWGRKQKSTPSTVEGQALVCSWRYIHFFFIFQVAYKQKFVLMGNDRSQDQVVSRDRALQVIHTPLPGPSLWQKWSLPGLFLTFFIFGAVAAAMGAGSTSQRCTDTSNADYNTTECTNYRFDQAVKSLRSGNGY